MADIDKSLPNVEQELKVPSPEEIEVAEQEKQQEVNEQGDPVEVTENEDGSVDINKMSSSIMKDAGIRLNDNELTNDVTIAAGERAMVAGDFKVSANLTINGVLTIV